MKTIRIEVAVPADDDVPGEHVCICVNNQLHFCFGETANGAIDWSKVRVRLVSDPRPKQDQEGQVVQS